MDWGSLGGSLGKAGVDLGLGITSLIMSNKHHKDNLAMMQQNLQFQKDQHTEAVNRYNKAMDNQQQGVAALGASFGAALEREQSQEIPTQRM